MAPPTVLFLPNDAVLDHNVSFGRAFQALTDERLISHRIFAPLARARIVGSEAALRELAAVAEETRPDLIFVQPMTRLPWTDEYLRDLVRRSGSPEVVYWEGDAVKSAGDPGPGSACWYRRSDTVFSVALGVQAQVIGRFTRRRPRYVPHVVPGRVLTGVSVPPIGRASYDAMHIGNCFVRLGALERIAGARDRHRVVRGLQRMQGCRLAVHGARWRGRGALGPLPFDEQVTALRTARFSINWDHCAGWPGYFSDRLPISLYAGRPHITSHIPHTDWLPDRRQGLHTVGSPAEAVNRARELLHTDDDMLETQGRAAHAWVRDRLTERNALLHMLGAHLDLPLPPVDPWAAIAAMDDMAEHSGAAL
ncbi:glycosyltransferase family protein [Streptomyces sp. NPDC004059]